MKEKDGGKGKPTYNVLMAIQALADAVDVFAHTPALSAPASSGVESGFDAEIQGQIANVSRMLRERKVQTIIQKGSIVRSFEAVASEGEDSIAAALAQLNVVLGQFDELISRERGNIEDLQAQADRGLATIAGKNVGLARRARKKINEFFKLGGALHNETVEFYYFLLSIRADYDPDARGGVSFEDPADLGAYLLEQMKA